MKLNEVKNTLKKLIPAKEPVLLVGAPGEGKTSIVVDVAKELSYDLVIRHPVVEESVDSKGLPNFYDGGTKAKFVLTDDWRRLCDADRPTVCLIDDMGQAAVSVQAPYMQWIHARECAGQKISPHVTFVACTNRRGDAAGVQGLITPLLGRFTAVLEVSFDHREWQKWAIANEMPPVLTAFANFKPDLISSFKPSRDMEPSGTPRTWASLGRLIKLGVTGHEAWSGAVGKGNAVTFTAFSDVWGELPDVDDVIAKADTYPVPERPDILYALMGSLSHNATVKNFDHIMSFVTRCPIEGSTVFLVDTYQRVPKISASKSFAKWVSVNKHVFL